jgi:PAS domain S-box-containing protein
MKRYIEKNIAFSGLGLALLLLAMVGGASYQSINRLLVTNKWVKHTYTVLENINGVSSKLKDADWGHREYVITRNKTFLKNFEVGVQTAKQEIKTLRELTADNPRQQQRLKALQPLIAQRLTSLQNLTDQRQQNPSNSDSQVTLRQEDAELQARIQTILDEMDAEEHQLLQRRTLESEASVRNTIILFGMGYTCSFGLLVGVFRLLQQRLRDSEALLLQAADRQQAEDALRESEFKFRAIFNQAFQFIGLLTPEGILLEANQTALDFAGVRAEDVIGRPFWEGLWWTLRREIQEQLKAAIARSTTDEFVRYEVDVRGADDKVVTIDFSLKPIKDEKGCVVLLIAEGRDITDRKQMETVLLHSEERWQLALKGNNDGIWDWNVETNQIYRSVQFLKILGYEDHEFGHSNEEWSTRIHPDDFDRVMAANQDYLEQKVPHYAVEFRLRCKDGTYKWVMSRGQAQWDEEGKPVRMVGSTRDITQRKQAEAALQKLNAELEERVYERTAQLEAANQLLLGQKQVLEMLSTGTSLPDMLDVLLQTIEQQSPEMLCSLLLLDPNGRHFRHGAAPSLPESYTQALDLVAIGDNVASCGAAVFLREPVMVSDIASDPRWANFRKLALNHGLRACWSQPILSNHGKLLGTFAIYYREPRRPSLKDLQLVETAAHLAGIAIEQKRVEQERTRLVAMLEASTDYIGTVDPQSNSLWNNAQMKQALGLDLKTETASLLLSDYHPQWALEVIQNQGLPTAIRDGSWVGETALLHHKGNEIPVSQMIIAHKSPDGGVEYFSTIMRDLSDRKQAEAALHKSYNLLRSVIDATSDVIFVKNLEGCYQLMNASGASLFNKQPWEILGQDDTVLFPAKSYVRTLADDQRIIASGKSETFEERLFVQGEWRTYLTTKSVYRDNDGNILGLVGLARDITPLKQTQEVLKESEERFRGTFEQAAVGIAHVNLQGRYLRCNQKFCDMVGYTHEEVLTRTFQDITYPKDLEVDKESDLLAGEALHQQRWLSYLG